MRARQEKVKTMSQAKAQKMVQALTKTLSEIEQDMASTIPMMRSFLRAKQDTPRHDLAWNLKGLIEATAFLSDLNVEYQRQTVAVQAECFRRLLAPDEDACRQT